MAQVAMRADHRLDALLDSLIAAWRDVPTVAREIDTWDLVDQIDYVEEWGAKLSTADWLGERDLSPEQRARHDELQRLARKYGPLLERLRLS